MRENRTSGSVAGAPGNGRPYAGSSEVGKAGHMAKDPTEARSPQRKLVPDMQDRVNTSQPHCGDQATGP
jgi:hypothetical protein